MATDANHQLIDIPSLLDKRSYRVYRLRIDQKKTFREIAEAVDLSRSGAHQIYQASIQRIKLKKRGGDVWPEFSLSLRAAHTDAAAFFGAGQSETVPKYVKQESIHVKFHFMFLVVDV